MCLQQRKKENNEEEKEEDIWCIIGICIEKGNSGLWRDVSLRATLAALPQCFRVSSPFSGRASRCFLPVTAAHSPATVNLFTQPLGLHSNQLFSLPNSCLSSLYKDCTLYISTYEIQQHVGPSEIVKKYKVKWKENLDRVVYYHCVGMEHLFNRICPILHPLLQPWTLGLSVGDPQWYI